MAMEKDSQTASTLCKEGNAPLGLTTLQATVDQRSVGEIVPFLARTFYLGRMSGCLIDDKFVSKTTHIGIQGFEMAQFGDQRQTRNTDYSQLAAVLERLCYAFGVPVEMVTIQQSLRTATPPQIPGVDTQSEDFRLMQAAQQLGIRLAPTRLSLRDAMNLVRESFQW